MNKDCAFLIAEKLKPSDLDSLALVNSFWTRIVRESSIWKKYVQKSFGEIEICDVKNAETFRDVYHAMSKAKNIGFQKWQMQHLDKILYRSPKFSMAIPIECLDTIIPRRGDTIFGKNGFGYRMRDISYWDGEKIIPPETFYTDYGTVPREFAYPEFPIGYFYHGYLCLEHCVLTKEMVKQYKEEGVINLIDAFPNSEYIYEIDDFEPSNPGKELKIGQIVSFDMDCLFFWTSD